jgi:ENTS family enterobactin (siderophore) exporter
VLVAVAVWGAAMAVFGLTASLPLALALLAVAGAADVISAVFRNTILQLTVPDSLRGRLSAAQIMVVTGGPRLGDVEAGAVASAVSTRFSIVSGGVACMAGVVLCAWLLPRFRAADVTADEADAIGETPFVPEPPTTGS